MMAAQTLEDAARSLAAKATGHLGANEIAHVSVRNLSSLGAQDVAKLQAAVERGVRRRARNPVQVEIAVTISENLRGFLLIAQVRDAVEMAAFPMEQAHPQITASVGKTLLWQQETAILDVAASGDQLLVLDTAGITRYEHRERMEAAPIAIATPRDPRGRLAIDGNAVTAEVAGSICRGTVPPLAVKCEPGGDITAGRNTLEAEGWPAHYSRVETGGETFLAGTDGRVHVYDAARKESGAFDGWGSDFAEACGGTRILASAPGDRETRDSIALYEVAGRPPARVSDPLEFPGPVTALNAGVAVARNLSTGRYEAYSLTVDCGR